MACMSKIHVTYNTAKRVIAYQKKRVIQGFRRLFLHFFSDVVPSEVTSAEDKFQQYDERFKDYVELQDCEKLDDDKKIRALLSEEQEVKQAARKPPGEAEPQINYHHWPCVHHIPWYPCFMASKTERTPLAGTFEKPHLVKKNTTYRLWSPVSRKNDGLLRRNNNKVTCSGRFDTSDDTRIEAIDGSRDDTDYFALVFKDTKAKKEYALTGKGKGRRIKAVEINDKKKVPKESLFEPRYFWSYTMFRNCSYRDCYLGCDSTGKATLVENGHEDPKFQYPNPQTLFVLNKINTNLTGDMEEE